MKWHNEKTPTDFEIASGVALDSSTNFYEEVANRHAIKHDQAKVPMELLSSIALVKTAEVLAFGKQKYAAHNWRKGMSWSRPAGAALRHLFAWLGGEDKDPESGLSHLAHAACCIMFLLEYETTKPDLDDRWKG